MELRECCEPWEKKCKELEVQLKESKDEVFNLGKQITWAGAENERLKAELQKRATQLGVACLEHDLTRSLTCGHCEDDLKAENERLKAELNHHLDAMGVIENDKTNLKAEVERLKARIDYQRSTGTRRGGGGDASELED